MRETLSGGTQYDRGSNPRTAEELSAAIQAAFRIERAEQFSIYHEYFLCEASPKDEQLSGVGGCYREHAPVAGAGSPPKNRTSEDQRAATRCILNRRRAQNGNPR